MLFSGFFGVRKLGSGGSSTYRDAVIFINLNTGTAVKQVVYWVNNVQESVVFQIETGIS